MKWIKVTDALPLAGKEVLCVVDNGKIARHEYAIAYLCCTQGWKIHKDGQFFVRMWAELPAIEPE